MAGRADCKIWFSSLNILGAVRKKTPFQTLEMKLKDAKEHSTVYKEGGLGLETLRQVSKNFPTELSVKYSTVMCYWITFI